MRNFGNKATIVWHDRKRIFGLPWTFSRYYIVRNGSDSIKVYTSIGLFSTKEEEVQCFRIFDISIFQSFGDKIFGVGTITLHCKDESNEDVYLIRIKNPYKVRNLLNELIEEDRQNKGFRLGEFHS